MGSIITGSDLNMAFLQTARMPVIVLKPYPRLIPENIENVSLNLLLAERLTPIPPRQRPLRIMDELKNILYKNSTPLLLDRYEMLFSPAWKLNVLKIFADIARIRPIYVSWPGQCKNGYLTYAGPDDPEYRNYRITDYDVIVVL